MPCAFFEFVFVTVVCSFNLEMISCQSFDYNISDSDYK